MFNRILAAPLAATLLVGLAFSPVARAQSDPSDLCAANVALAEGQTGIPKGLLAAISSVESGRWDKERRTNIAWPWTVTSGANGQFFATKAEAIAEVRRMKAQGIRNIDVGCMQINLHHHADAFDTLEEAFDPTVNVAYAARFLTSLYDTHRNWVTAASHYHSATPELGARYRAKVLAAWTGENAGSQASQPPPAAAQTLVQTANWSLSQPSQAMASARPASPAKLAMAEMAKAAPEATQGRVRSQPPAQPSQTEVSREEARAFANAWREAKLAEYRNRKAAKGGA